MDKKLYIQYKVNEVVIKVVQDEFNKLCKELNIVCATDIHTYM